MQDKKTTASWRGFESSTTSCALQNDRALVASRLQMHTRSITGHMRSLSYLHTFNLFHGSAVSPSTGKES